LAVHLCTADASTRQSVINPTSTTRSMIVRFRDGARALADPDGAADPAIAVYHDGTLIAPAVTWTKKATGIWECSYTTPATVGNAVQYITATINGELADLQREYFVASFDVRALQGHRHPRGHLHGHPHRGDGPGECPGHAQGGRQPVHLGDGRRRRGRLQPQPGDLPRDDLEGWLHFRGRELHGDRRFRDTRAHLRDEPAGDQPIGESGPDDRLPQQADWPKRRPNCIYAKQ
jgi:hypothetical protein